MDRDVLCMLYAGFLAAGGAAGFVKKKSIPSLVAGLASGAVVAAVTHYRVPTQPAIVAVVSGGLAVAMGARYRRSGKFMPPGLVAIVSLAVFLGQAVYIAGNGLYRK